MARSLYVPRRFPRVDYTVTRRFQVLDAYNRVTESETTEVVQGSYPQPWRGDTQLVMPVGYREQDLQVMFTTADLKPAKEGVNDFADRLELDGVAYEVIDSRRWGAIIIHNQITLVRVPD